MEEKGNTYLYVNILPIIKNTKKTTENKIQSSQNIKNFHFVLMMRLYFFEEWLNNIILKIYFPRRAWLNKRDLSINQLINGLLLFLLNVQFKKSLLSLNFNKPKHKKA